MRGLSPKFPLYFDPHNGSYANNMRIEDVVKQNFKNLLLTNPGERMMDIKFGAGLRRFFFEPRTDATNSRISNAIHEQVGRYMSFIQVNQIKFLSDPRGQSSNLLGMTVEYSIIPMGNSDILTIKVASEGA